MFFNIADHFTKHIYIYILKVLSNVKLVDLRRGVSFAIVDKGGLGHEFAFPALSSQHPPLVRVSRE